MLLKNRHRRIDAMNYAVCLCSIQIPLTAEGLIIQEIFVESVVACVCKCECVCEKEREKEEGGKRGRGVREKERYCVFLFIVYVFIRLLLIHK